ncbi:MAG TPA: 4-hydroxybenzoate 3-monooxygenase [Casimicrobiaceae bacterium]|nr:4-hydroxybenzoate 3-monooxygenase [Casimicrobiaceae bacterium]
MRTQVAIIGAGPAGLMLSHLLHRAGIATLIVEARSREHCEHRVRAGVLEQHTVDLMNETGVGSRLQREGLVHHGIKLRFGGRTLRIDFSTLTPGRAVTVYGQQEVVKDLIAARVADGGTVLFDATATEIRDIDGKTPRLTFAQHGKTQEIQCDFIAGCDGFHGIARPAFPASARTIYERSYPFAWLGVLVSAAPSSEELIYALHDDGFALLSMRSPEVTRLYLQCEPDEDLAKWPDARVWAELHKRLEDCSGPRLNEGPITQKGVTPMRSFVAEPMRYGHLFLAGDAAHIVPPTGAKGMNLAIADVRVLASALQSFYREGKTDALDAYSDRCLVRVWKAQRFSWWMTSLLHRFHDDGPFDRRRQLAELDYLEGSRAAQTALAENYVGLPFDE